jgi:superfamily II DNA/RNA helicase
MPVSPHPCSTPRDSRRFAHSSPRFEALDLIEPTQRVIKSQDYTVPTPIQHEAIPLLLSGSDLLGKAQTSKAKRARLSLYRAKASGVAPA